MSLVAVCQQARSPVCLGGPPVCQRRAEGGGALSTSGALIAVPRTHFAASGSLAAVVGVRLRPGTAMLEKLHRERRYTDGQKDHAREHAREHAGEHAGEQAAGDVAAGSSSRRRSEGD